MGDRAEGGPPVIVCGGSHNARKKGVNTTTHITCPSKPPKTPKKIASSPTSSFRGLLLTATQTPNAEQCWGGGKDAVNRLLVNDTRKATLGEAKEQRQSSRGGSNCSYQLAWDHKGVVKPDADNSAKLFVDGISGLGVIEERAGVAVWQRRHGRRCMHGSHLRKGPHVVQPLSMVILRVKGPAARHVPCRLVLRVNLPIRSTSIYAVT